jgi:hypothetical protein
MTTSGHGISPRMAAVFPLVGSFLTPYHYTATCAASYTPTGAPTYGPDGVRYTYSIVAGRYLTSSTQGAALTVWDINATTGDLELVWSSTISVSSTDTLTPKAVVTDGTNVAMTAYLKHNNGHSEIVTAVYDLTSGACPLGPMYWTSTGAGINLPVGVVLDDDNVAVGGSGYNDTDGQQEMLVVNYTLSTGAAYWNWSSGGTGHVFAAACATGDSGNFVVVGRDTPSSTSTDGDWMVVDWSVVSPGTPAITWGPVAGISDSNNDDIPKACCALVQPAPGGLKSVIVTGECDSFATGNSDIDTVQFDITSGAIQWYNHYVASAGGTHYQSSPNSVNVLEPTGNLSHFQAFVGATVLDYSATGSADYLFPKYNCVSIGNNDNPSKWVIPHNIWHYYSTQTGVTSGTVITSTDRSILMTGTSGSTTFFYNAKFHDDGAE